MGCPDCNQIKHNCFPKAYATCTMYERTLPTWSKFKNEKCVSLDETTWEAYDLLADIKAQLDFSWVVSTCLSITKNTDGEVTLKTFLQSILTEIEALKCGDDSNLKDIDIDITNFDLDFKCFLDKCDDSKPKKLSTLLQQLLDKSCEETTPDVLINGGTISLKTKITHLQSTVASSGTLPAGREGLEKFIKCTVYGGNIVIASSYLQAGSFITFNSVGDFIHLIYTDNKWSVLTNSGCVIA